MFVDNVKIYIKAGDGGNGAIAFHRENTSLRAALMAATAVTAVTWSSALTRVLIPCSLSVISINSLLKTEVTARVTSSTELPHPTL